MTNSSEVCHGMENREIFSGRIGRSCTVREAYYGGGGVDAIEFRDKASNSFIIRSGEVGVVVDNPPVRRCGRRCHVAVA